MAKYTDKTGSNYFTNIATWQRNYFISVFKHKFLLDKFSNLGELKKCHFSQSYPQMLWEGRSHWEKSMLLRIFLRLNTTGPRGKTIKQTGKSVQFSRARESKTDLCEVFKFHFETCLRCKCGILDSSCTGFFWGTFSKVQFLLLNFSKRTVHPFNTVFLTTTNKP